MSAGFHALLLADASLEDELRRALVATCPGGVDLERVDDPLAAARALATRPADAVVLAGPATTRSAAVAAIRKLDARVPVLEVIEATARDRPSPRTPSTTELLDLQASIARLVVSDDPPPEVLTTVLSSLAEAFGGLLAAVWQPGGGGELAARAVWPSAGSVDTVAFALATMASPLPPGSGLPGQAFATGESQRAEQVTWPTLATHIRELSEQTVNIAVALSLGEKRLGVLGLVVPRDGTGGTTAQAALELAGHQLAQYLDRHAMRAAMDGRARALTASTTGIAIVDATRPDFPFVYVNPAFVQLTGYAAHELLGRGGVVIRSPQSDPETVAAVTRAMRTGQPFRGRVIAQRRDGSPFWAEITLSPVRDDRGRLVQMIGVVNDVTEHQETLARLVQAEQRHRRLVERIPVIVYSAEWKPTVPFTFISPQIEQLLGRAPEWFFEEDEHWYDVIHPDDRERVRAAEAGSHARREPMDIEYRMIRPDGEEVWVWETSTLVGGEDGGEPDAVQGVVVDITARRQAEAALRESEAVFESVVAALDEGILVRDTEGVVVACNEAAARIAGVPREEIRGSRSGDWPGVCFEDGTPATPENDPATIVQRTGVGIRDTVFTWPDGHGGTTWVSVNTQPLIGPGGDVTGVVSTYADITARRLADQAVREERDRAEHYFELAGTIMVVLGPDQAVTRINRRGCEVLGYEAGELLGANWFDTVVPEADREARRATFLAHAEGSVAVTEAYENLVLTATGERRMVAWHKAVLLDEHGEFTGTLSSGEDVTEKRKAEEQIAFLAYHDSLTGLPNRTLLEEHLELALARARRNAHAVALLYLDLDDFKLVNDSLGHAAGDELLQRIAERLRSVVRTSDLLARQGGDEFLLLLTDLSGDAQRAAERVAEQITRAMEEPVAVAGAEFQVGASIGISLYPRDASDVDALLKHADAAMYQAKSSDRSSFSVYERPSADSLDRLSMSARLRRALGGDELVLYYQPIYALSTGRLAAVEALIRWQDPERGLLLPGAFIPIAEETGLIEQIGEWVLTAACAQLRQWRSEGLETHVNINVSPRQLRRTSFARQVVRALERHGVDPEALTLEITETTAMRDPERVEPMLAELHRTGVRLALDDFGSGHSSLARLREMPFDQLKIDRRFLRDVPERGDAASMVTAIVRLARALGMLAVAEGVETAAQRRFLEERDCPLAQGFHLGRPMTAVEVAAQLAAESPLPEPGMIGPDGGSGALQIDRP